MKPTFLYIGVARAGSTWLFHVLCEHPDVYVPPAKGVDFFDKYFCKGADWYFPLFAGAGNAKAVGDISHDYYVSKAAALRIHGLLPNAKLICCLREPVDKVISGYFYNRNTHIKKTVSLLDYAHSDEVLTQVDYYPHLRCYYDLFPPENIQILLYDELRSDPCEFVRKVYSFIGVAPDYEPPSLWARINAAHEPRAQSVAHLAKRAADGLRRMGMPNWVGRIKQNGLVNGLLFKRMFKRPDVSREVEEELKRVLRKDMDKLEELIGKPLPSGWKE